MPETSSTRAHLAVSVLRNAVNSALVLVTGVAFVRLPSETAVVSVRAVVLFSAVVYVIFPAVVK